MAKVLFLYDLRPQQFESWTDGLREALYLLEKDVELTLINVHDGFHIDMVNDYDMVIGWGTFMGRIADSLEQSKLVRNKKIGLCVGGSMVPPNNEHLYDVVYYETEWYRKQYLRYYLQMGGKAIHAFGVNGKVFFNDGKEHEKIFDYVACGSFALWKRHELIKDKPGLKFVFGEVQKENMQESLAIGFDLLTSHVGIMDMIPQEQLAKIYRCTDTVFIGNETHGGGERTVLEARACGAKVEVQEDNPKLLSMLDIPITDHVYYYHKLKEGIEYALSRGNK